ncbi:unnamed protein product [Arabidopsis thaliana]|uniref:Uncharacterized protein n=1 Tax=Arabidopsis thaliana TaxID=3702 RepID=A0A654EG59_ARATH|nr:unnamed protein product [Arabidopsis thaliana]
MDHSRLTHLEPLAHSGSIWFIHGGITVSFSLSLVSHIMGDLNIEAYGYTGICFPRGEGYKRDGCAIFFKPKFAELITYNSVDYNNLAESRCVATFKILKPFNHVVIVATTHLKSGKPDEWNDVKLAQAKSLMFRLAMFKRTISAVENCSPSVILADNIPIVWPLGGEEEDTGFGLCSAYGFTKGEPKLTKYVP